MKSPSTLRVLAALLLAGLGLSAPASAQLLHRWSFDGNGTIVQDSVTGATGTILGGAAMDGSGALQFDGDDDYVALPAGLASAQPIQTFELWFTWAGGGSNSRIFDFGNNNGTAGQTFLALTPRSSGGTAAALFQTILGGGSKKVFADEPTIANEVTHIALVVDSVNDVMKIYRDGALQDSLQVFENLDQLEDENMWLGRSNWINDPYFEGSLDELRIFGFERTAAEIAGSFAAGPDSLGTLGIVYCQPAAANATGLPASIGASGSEFAADNDFTLQATSLPPGSLSIFLTSSTQGFFPNAGGGRGTICIAGQIGRLIQPGQVLNASDAGVVTVPLDLTQHPATTTFVPVLAGQTWNFQAWYRDSDGGVATSNFSDALEMTFL